MFSSGFEKTAKVLTTADRKKIKPKDYALPGGHYPIEDEAHGRSALSYGSRFASSKEYATIKRKVHAKFPHIGEK